MHRFLVVFEKTKDGYSAYSPDLLGCVAAGRTKKEAEKNMHTAIEMHIQGMVEDKIPIPKSSASSEFLVFQDIDKGVA
ncbi:MAG: type II toxin-antitoxin system HicB family antitoxin [Candidatus Altiarchaeota archaeon]